MAAARQWGCLFAFWRVCAAGAAAGAALPDDLAGLLIDRLTLLPLRCR
jgi:hypothetical protein